MPYSHVFIFLVGYGISVCPATDENCLACKGSTCVFCVKSYNDGGVCKRAKNPVKFCLSYNSNQLCESCIQGYFLTSSRYCKRIPLINCAEKSSFNTCKICFNGYKTERGICTSRKCLSPYCSQCSLDLKGNEKCVQCQDKYHLQSSNNEYSCVKSTEGLENCMYASKENRNLCGVCNLDFYYRDGKCVKSSVYSISLSYHFAFYFTLIFILYYIY